MNPITVTARLKDALIRYLLTTFDVNRDGENAALYAQLRAAFEADTALVTGPFLELAQPYQHGQSIRELVDAGYLSRRFLEGGPLHHPPIPLDAPLYQHQQHAIEQIAQQRSVIVSSGTGSGKTESFMIPILSDLLDRPAHGVRAVLVYPLNALVNDQLQRLQKLLAGTDITYGRYTSELKESTVDGRKQWNGNPPERMVISREQIRNKELLPNILITNYAMLELLLLRPQDSGLFDHAHDWKFVVLDEAHSYSGAKGIEVAYLLRRLKQRLGKQPGEMVCIGTSATLTNDKLEGVKFAETLFGEPFTSDQIIFGASISTRNDMAETIAIDPKTYLGAEWLGLIDKLRNPACTVQDAAAAFTKLGMLSEPRHTAATTIEQLLYTVLQRNPQLRHLRELLQAQPDVPLNLSTAAQQIFPSTADQRFSPPDAVATLHQLVELGSRARLQPDQAPLLPARYHLFARSPQGVWACLNPNCTARPEGHTEPWSKLFTSPCLTCDACEGAVFPVVVCRSCGQVYLKTYYQKNTSTYQTEAQSIRDESPRYFAWKPADSNAALSDEDADDDDQPPTASGTTTRIEKQSVEICLAHDCRQEKRDCKTGKHTNLRGQGIGKIKLYPVIENEAQKGKGTRSQPVCHLDCCARCGNQSRIQEDEIATPIMLRGSVPLAVLTMELYRQLPSSDRDEISSKPGAGRKLLSFYDSRQGAARYAALLQDVFNQDLYRYLLPQAIHAQTQADDADSVDLTALAESASRIGWDELRVFQTGLEDEIDEIFSAHNTYDRARSWDALNKDQRKRVQKFITARILAEVTTNRRGRQSLEALGLLAVRYFETPPPVADLAAQLGLSDEQTPTLLNYLLDTVRDQKTITLPTGIPKDHSAFGRNTSNNVLIRGKSDSPSKDETPWLGSTLRHIRSRIMKLALETAGRPADEAAVRAALLHIWNWLIDPEQGRFVALGSGRYQLNTNSLFFSAPAAGWQQCERCQRLRHGAIALPCPAPRCGGEYHPLDRDLTAETNYYRYIFTQGLIPMRVEEHTAQLASDKAQQYQDAFKQGDINILSCSTTFEMGIDLGDLQAVVMNNVPPNVANYRQRAGRAGRRASGTAFIVTWAQDRPHDQIYYQQPPEIIRGQVRIPRLTLVNPTIRDRHLNAVLLADLLRWLTGGNAADISTVGAFFDPQMPAGRHYNQLEAWYTARQVHLAAIINQLTTLTGEHLPALTDAMQIFRTALQQVEALYSHTSTAYRRDIEQAKLHYNTATGKAADEADAERRTKEKLLKRLNDDNLIDHLSSRGVLPSYSFPLYTVELELPADKRDTFRLRLERDLSRAITEFAPGNEIVADKRLWESAGVRYLRDTPRSYAYQLCQQCNSLTIRKEAGLSLLLEECPVCHNRYASQSRRYLVPDGFSTDKASGKLAGQYVRQAVVEQQTAVFIPTTVATTQATDMVAISRHADGDLHFINQGRDGKGYHLCQVCGMQVGGNQKACPKCKSTHLEQLDLGHNVKTETLLIQFFATEHVPIPGHMNRDFWYTLQTALVIGAARALQIERSDIDGTLFPTVGGVESWRRAIVLYDKVPGGAGYMQDIEQNFTAVVREALKTVNCSYCDENTSCTHCLRDYGNQRLYQHLKRGRVIPFLEALYAYQSQQIDEYGTVPLLANQPLEVVWERVSRARHSIHLAADRLTDQIQPGKTDSWLDLLSERLRAGLNVHLLLRDVPSSSSSMQTTNPADLIVMDKLRVMLGQGQGLKLRQVSQLPDWQLVIDAGHDGGRAFQFTTDSAVYDAETAALTSRPIGEPLLHTTTQPNGIAAALQSFTHAEGKGKEILAPQLQPPPQVSVTRIATSGQKTRENDIPALRHFFERPVISLFVLDPYLLDHERLVNRLSAYIELAAAGGALQKVTVRTRDAQIENKSRDEQTKAIKQLEQRFPELEIKVNRVGDRQDHDRYLEIKRADKTTARLYIGRGLDFIRADGTVQGTYLVTEEVS